MKYRKAKRIKKIRWFEFGKHWLKREVQEVAVPIKPKPSGRTASPNIIRPQRDQSEYWQWVQEQLAKPIEKRERLAWSHWRHLTK